MKTWVGNIGDVCPSIWDLGTWQMMI